MQFKLNEMKIQLNTINQSQNQESLNTTNPKDKNQKDDRNIIETLNGTSKDEKDQLSSESQNFINVIQKLNEKNKSLEMAIHQKDEEAAVMQDVIRHKQA